MTIRGNRWRQATRLAILNRDNPRPPRNSHGRITNTDLMDNTQTVKDLLRDRQPDFSCGGTEMQLKLLLQNLDRNLVVPYLCLLNGQSEESRALEPENVTSTRLGIKRLISLRAMTGTLRFRKFLRQNKIQIVQSFFPDSTRFASPISKLCGVGKVLGTRRNIGHWMTRRDEWIAKFYNRTFIDQIIANCEAARQSVINQESMAPSRVLVIPNGIDLKRFADCQPWTQTDGQPTMKIGMVGNLRDVKGPDLLIDAANILLKQNNNLQFVIAGEGRPAASTRRKSTNSAYKINLSLIGFRQRRSQIAFHPRYCRVTLAR